MRTALAPPELFHELDRLSARFPRAAWLAALRLRWTLRWMQHDRLGGELSDIDLKYNRQRGIPSPEKTFTPPNFTRAQLDEAIAAARRGQNMEPDNAFWDWCLAQLHLFGWRDAAAWRYLESGARKARYDTHERAWLEALLFAHEAELGRPLLAEEKDFVRRAAEPASSGNGRGIGRVVTWQAVKAERRGDHRSALRILTAFGRLQELRARRAYSQRESWQATVLLVYPLGRALPWNTTLPGVASLASEAHVRGASFARYAAAHGQGHGAQAKAAQGLVSAATALARHQERVLHDGGSSWEVAGAAPSWGRTLATYGATALLWQQAAIAGALWLALGLMLRCLGLPRVAPLRSDRVFGALLAALLLLALARGAGVEIAQLGGASLGVPLAAMPSGVWHDAMSLLLPVCAALPVLFASCLVQGLTLWRAAGDAASPQASPQALLQASPSWRERWGQTSGTRLAPFVAAAALNVFTLAMLAWWQTALTNAEATLIVPRAVAGFSLGTIGGRSLAFAALHPGWPLAAMLLGLFAGWARWIFAAAPRCRAIVIYRLCWLREMLGATALLGAALYLAASLWSLPVCRVADADFQRALAYGDNALRQN